MRGIAAEAGVSLGSAYYYFESKEDLVMAFYERAMEAMAAQNGSALAGYDEFADRVAALMEVKFDYFQTEPRLPGALFRHAADPQNRLSPFSEATRTFASATRIFRAGDRHHAGGIRVPADLADILPRMLWLYQMGLILHWIYDRSPRQRRTRPLREKSLALWFRF